MSQVTAAMLALPNGMECLKISSVGVLFQLPMNTNMAAVTSWVYALLTNRCHISCISWDSLFLASHHCICFLCNCHRLGHRCTMILRKNKSFRISFDGFLSSNNRTATKYDLVIFRCHNLYERVNHLPPTHRSYVS